MSAMDTIVDRVLPLAAGCPEPTAVIAVRQAAIEFCRRTRLWRVELDCEADTNPVAVVPYTDTPNDNELTLPADAQLYQIDRVFFDARKLDPKDTLWLDQHYPLWRTGTDVPGVPGYYTQLQPNTIFLVPGFEAGDVKAYLWLRPTEEATSLPDFLADHYAEEIAWGALGRVLAIDKQQFSNPNLAAYYADKFATRLGELSSANSKGQQRAPMRFRPSFF